MLKMKKKVKNSDAVSYMTYGMENIKTISNTLLPIAADFARSEAD